MKKDSEFNEFANVQEKKPKLRSARKKGDKAVRVLLIILIVILSIMIAIVAAGKITGLGDLGKTKPQSIDKSTHNPILRADGSLAEREEEVYNFLVVGQDLKANLTDVMMLINFNVPENKMTIMQIPRDTLVVLDAYACMECKKPVTTREGESGKCSSCGGDTKTLCTNYERKMNSVYHQYYSSLKAKKQEDNIKFGMEGLALTLEQALNISIDSYAHMDLEGFRKIVDEIGGVDMYVSQDMYYNDPDQNLYINLKKGQQKLDGEMAEQFVRFRSGYIRADISRQNAQKEFMVAFLQSFKQNVNITNVLSTATTMLKYVTHSVPTEDLDYYARAVLEMDFSNITMCSAPFSEHSPYLVLQRYNLLKIINENYNVYDTDIPDEQFDTERIFTVTSNSTINSKYLTTEEFEDTYSAEDIKENGLEKY